MADWIKKLCLCAVERGDDHVDVWWVPDDLDYSLLRQVIADLGFSSFHWIRTPDKSSVFPRIYFKDVRE